MELSKYQKALRAMTNRNSNLDRVIYDPSIVELDTMPVENPPMDNVMPSFDGREDPKVLEDYQQMELADGGVVEREGFGDGSVTKVQKRSKNVTGENLKLFNEGKLHHLRIGKDRETFYGTKEELNEIFKNRSKPGGKRIDTESLTYKEGFGTKAQLIEKLKEKGIKVSNSTSANRFAKTFNIPFEKNPYQKSFNIYDLTSLDDPDFVKKIQKAQVLSGAATPEAVKEFRLSGTDEAGNKVTTNQRRQSAILGNKGLGSKSSFIPKKTTAQVLGHAGDIFDNEKITADDLVYTDKRLNSKLQSIDFQIRKIKDKKLEIQNSNISNIEKRKLLEQADSELIDLISKSDGFKNVQLTDGTKFGTTRYNIDPTDLFPGSSEKQVTDFMKQYFYYSNPRGKNFGKIKPKFLNKKGKLLEDLPGKVKDEIYHGLLFEKNRKASLKAAKNFPKKKIEAIIKNIGCKPGQRVTKENGGSCYTDGLKKIKENKLNNNEFNILRKAVMSPAAQTAIKYGGKALKGLGAVLAPIVLYDTYDQYKKGKPLAEIIEYGLIGTSGSREIRKMANYTPEEREAVQQAQQYERNEEDISGLSSDFDTSTNLSDSEVSELAATGSKRVDDLMIAQDKAKEKQRVYTGAPEIEDYGERIGFKLGTIVKGISWIDKRIQDINKLIKSKKAGPEDFLDEIQLLEKAEELNLTEGQVNQILKQQQQQRMDNYRKLPIQGEPAAKSRLPIDD